MVGRTGGATPDIAKWISDSASTLSPLQMSIWCTLHTKKRMLGSAISMTARLELRAERERKVGWKGQVGGPAGTASGASAKRASAAHPSHNPTLPTTPFPPQHLVHAGQVPAGQIPNNGRGLMGAAGVQVLGVGLLVAVLGVRGPQVKKSPLQPILGVGGGRHPMVAAGGHHQQHVPPLHVNGVPSHLPRIPQGRPRLHRHLVVL